MKKNIKVNKIEIKKKFEEKYNKLLGDDYKKLLYWIFRPLKKSIRINTIKVKDDLANRLKSYPFDLDIKATDVLKRLEEKGFELEKISFYEYGFWVKNRVDIGNTIEFQLGYYYPQEAASMIPVIALDPQPGELILDMAAAPGSKTTQIAMHMENRGIIIANDISKYRLASLALNLQRQGVVNTIITNLDGRKFGKLDIKFDRVLLDAPCSGSGAIRKSYSALIEWSENSINRLSKLQKSLILSAFDSLKDGGILVYSTCSMEPEENEEVVNYLLEKRENAKIEKIKIDNLNYSEPFLEYNGKKFFDDIKYTIRLWPWDNDTEGFYIAKIKKR